MKEEGVVSGLTPTRWALEKPAVGWSLYRDANPVRTSSLPNDIATAPSGPFSAFHTWRV